MHVNLTALASRGVLVTLASAVFSILLCALPTPETPVRIPFGAGRVILVTFDTVDKDVTEI